MIKTGQNLKLLEKKVRQATRLIAKLKEEKSSSETAAGSARYDDLPLLRGSDSSRSESGEIEKLLTERKQLSKQINKILQLIEEVIG